LPDVGAYGWRGHSCAVLNGSATADTEGIEHAPKAPFLAKLEHADKQQHQQCEHRAAPSRDVSRLGRSACETRPRRRVTVDASEAGNRQRIGIGHDRHHNVEILRHAVRRCGLRPRCRPRWYGVVRYGIAWYAIAWYAIAWYGIAWYGIAWYGIAWYGIAWYAIAWYDIACYGSVWSSIVQRRNRGYCRDRWASRDRRCGT